MQSIETDIVIVGGGIAGSWMLRTLTQQGYDVLLLEADSIGAAQSTRSQGIIHGGIKYALNGVLSQASDAIKEMPQRWKDCLQGTGEIDLRGVTQLSDAHYLWSQKSLGAKITSFFAKKAMSGRVDTVAKNAYPSIFCDSAFKGNLYKLNEVVLDIPSVLHKLIEPVKQRILKMDTAHCQWQRNSSGEISALRCERTQLELKAQRFIFAAGKGNGAILEQLQIEQPQMQLRPLHMVSVTHSLDLPIYAHCIGASSKPLVTVTHHPHNNGRYTWYLGGDLAETGVELSEAAQIEKAQALLVKLLPWVNLQDAHWQGIKIERAEPKQSSLSRPDSAFSYAEYNYIVAWPTKLALAPDLSDQVQQLLTQQQVTPKHRADLSLLAGLATASVSTTAWAAHDL